jgi:hypothetical protein
MNGAGPSVDFEPLRAMQRWLALAGDDEVAIPFAERLADLVPVDQLRMRRDFRQLLTVIQSIALLHQRQRERDANGRIVATVADYRMARDLLIDVFTATAAGGVTATVRETTTALCEMYKGQPLTVKNVAGELGLAKNTAHYRINKAIELGFIVNQESRKGQPAQLVPGDPLPDYRPALPDPDELLSDQPKGARTHEF